MSETKIRTYSVQVPDDVFTKMKTIENGLEVNRDALIAAIADFIINAPQETVAQIAQNAIDYQTRNITEKASNGGFGLKKAFDAAIAERNAKAKAAVEKVAGTKAIDTSKGNSGK